jgi:hypothetical protein
MGIEFVPDTSETRYKLQQEARLAMICKLEQDIIFDMQVCDIEGWDKMEYIRQIRKVVNSYGERKENE